MDNPSGEILLRHCFCKYFKKVSNFGQSQGCIPIGICRSEYVEEIKTAGRNRIALNFFMNEANSLFPRIFDTRPHF